MPFSAFGCAATVTPTAKRMLQEQHEHLSDLQGETPKDHRQTKPHELETAEGESLQAKARILQATSGGAGSIPSSYDLRQDLPKCTGVPRSSGYCSASWAFSAVGAFEKQLCRVSNGTITKKLSVQRVLDCSAAAGACSHGSILDAHAAMLRVCPPVSSGYPTGIEARYPSIAETAYQTRITSSVAGASATNIVMGQRAMQSAILLYGAVVASFALYQ